MRRGVRAALASAALLLGGCAGDGPNAPSGDSAFDLIQQEIFNPNCLSAGCHNSTSQAGGMDLSPGVSYGSLVNVVPDNPVAAARDLLRVTPFEPDQSFLIIKLTDPAPGEGSLMPLGMDPLAPDQIEMIRAWILDGAPPPSTGGPTPTRTPLPSTPTATRTPSITRTASATVTGTAPPTATASPSPTPTATSAVSLAIIQAMIFDATCTTAFCHDSQGMSGGLVLEAGQSYANLVGVEPTNPAALEAGLLRVDPGDPDNSFILIKLDDPSPEEGSRMPLGLPPLSASEVQLIRAWIAAGAPPE